MDLIKILGKTLYVIIILVILIYGILGIGDILTLLGINGFANQFLQYTLSIYGLGMFAYDINKVYKKQK